MTNICIGIDPGARHVAVCVVVEDTKQVLYSASFKREEATPQVTWATEATRRVQEVVQQYRDQYGTGNVKIGIENVTRPNSHHGKKMQLLDPIHAIRTGIVLGALALAFPNAVVIRPNKNGSQELDTYPEELKNRRPKTLLGVTESGTRNHERSAYDIANLIPLAIQEGYVLDDNGTTPVVKKKKPKTLNKTTTNVKEPVKSPKQQKTTPNTKPLYTSNSGEQEPPNLFNL